MTYIGIIIMFVFVNNFILSQFLGLCPFIGVSKNVDSAIGMGFAVTFVMSIAALTTWAIYNFILAPLDITFLQTITFILVIATLVQLVEMVIQKTSPPLYKSLGIYLPLITTNCAVLGIALIAVRSEYSALESFVAGIAAGLGFLLAIVLMSTIRERMDREWVPKPLRGTPIAFITGGLMALAFMAFDKALLNNLVG
ncbi:MAG: electron transport complex subunit RsxA [Spirochaetales bacterium]|nr:electron transport complex subunit RsxA [Spirochaetales bacterium]MCF7937146.1 electron transport complex subunit RsxA [Spirochaetales bacterium]